MHYRRRHVKSADAQDGNLSLQRRLKYFAQPELLLIDEVRDLSYANRHADLLFDIINRSYENKATIITTNRPFSEWNEVFPNAACVVSLVDGLVHHAQIIAIKGESYWMKEAQENTAKQQSKKPSNENRNHQQQKRTRDRDGEDVLVI